jgi:phosphate-selective porin OprO and OprP
MTPFARSLTFALLLPLTASLSFAVAISTAAITSSTGKKPVTLAEQLDDLGRVYADSSNPFVQEVWLLGRYHGQQHWIDGSRGGYEESWEQRRFRIGTQMRLLKILTLHAQMVSAPDMEPFYGGFTELWAQWSFHDALNLTIGQQKHRFTHDRNVSSRYLNYLERAMLTNLFALDYTPAVTLSGRFGRFSYYTGLFSNSTYASMQRAFLELNSSWSYLAVLTYDLQKSLGTDQAFLNLSYLHSDPDPQATLMNRFEHGLSAALILTDGPVALVTEITSGLGGVRGDAHGINIQPSLHLTDKLQLVARYQLAIADQANGLRAQRRYERNVGLNTGNLYQAITAGLNYHLIGHRLKLMTGIEYATLGGRDSWTSYAAIRLFWGPHSRGPFPMAQTLEGLW